MTSPGSVLAAAVEEVERQRPEWNVPALELAVVAPGLDDLATALGRRGVDDAEPIGATTLFHHGSCAKGYTALLAALLAEDGALDLDAPVHRLVPELRLPDPVLAQRITVRDLLSHRSGLGRHDLAWILRPELDSTGLLDALAVLPPAGDLRAGFGYSNFGYGLVGIALERATGVGWAELVRQRVLHPAGMKQTVLDAFPQADSPPDRATPHLLRDGRPVPTAWRTIGSVAPAGQLVTCAEDAAAWLHVHLGDGPPAIPAAAVRATHAAAVTLPPEVNSHPPLRWLGYGLGWVTGTFRGRPVLWHSGGVDGFLTNTLLLPEDGIGVTASANLHMSDFPFAVVHELADRLLGTAGAPSWYERARAEAEPPAPATPRRRPDASPVHELAEYAGEYVDPGYGRLVITVADGALAACLESGELALTHRHFDTWDARYDQLDDAFPLTFLTDADGAVAEIRVPIDAGAPPVSFRRLEPTQGDNR